jgi:hypothetical protein
MRYTPRHLISLDLVILIYYEDNIFGQNTILYIVL